MRYTVNEDAIAAAQRALDDVAEAVAEIRAGLGADGPLLAAAGDPELAAAIDELVTRWLWAMVVMGGDAQRTSGVLGLAAQGYRRTESLAAQAFQP